MTQNAGVLDEGGGRYAQWTRGSLGTWYVPQTLLSFSSWLSDFIGEVEYIYAQIRT